MLTTTQATPKRTLQGRRNFTDAQTQTDETNMTDSTNWTNWTDWNIWTEDAATQTETPLP